MTSFEERLIKLLERLLSILDQSKTIMDTSEKQNGGVFIGGSYSSLSSLKHKSSISSSIYNTLKDKNIEDQDKSIGSSSTRRADGAEQEKTKVILDYLNKKLKSKYRPSGPGAKFIRARLSDGFTVEDCRAVIDNQISLWRGTDMHKYLRPETLFRPTKFESYVNDAHRCKTEDGKDFEDAYLKREKEEEG